MALGPQMSIPLFEPSKKLLMKWHGLVYTRAPICLGGLQVRDQDTVRVTLS